MSVYVVAFGSLGDALPLILVLKELVSLERDTSNQHVVAVSRGVTAMVTELIGELPSQLCIEEISSAGVLFDESASPGRGMMAECNAVFAGARSKDALLFNLHSSFAVVIAEALNIPCGVLSPCLPPPPPAGARRAWTALLDQYPSLRSRIMASSAWTLHGIECWMLPLFFGRGYQRLRKSWGLPPFPLLHDTFLFHHGIPGWIGVSERLVYATSTPALPSTWHLDGPWLPKSSRTSPPWTGEDAVVLVSFGSMTEAGLAPPLAVQRRLARELGQSLGHCVLHVLTPEEESEAPQPSPKRHAPSPKRHAPSPKRHASSPKRHAPSPKRHASSPKRHVPSPSPFVSVLDERHGPMDHDILLERVALWVHHGGCGTVHEAVRRRIPQVVLPCGFDQATWAARVEAAGLGKHGPPWEEEGDLDRWIDRVCAVAREARRVSRSWDDVERWTECTMRTAEKLRAWLTEVTPDD